MNLCVDWAAFYMVCVVFISFYHYYCSFVLFCFINPDIEREKRDVNVINVRCIVLPLISPANKNSSNK